MKEDVNTIENITKSIANESANSLENIENRKSNSRSQTSGTERGRIN